MEYTFTAYTAEKRFVKGAVDAPSEALAEEALYRAGYALVIGLKPKPPPFTLRGLTPSLTLPGSQEVVDFSRQMATLIGSGVTIVTALELLQGQAARASLRDIIGRLAGEIREGNSFSEALARHPRVFSNAFCSIIKASEQAGALEDGLRQMANFIEAQAEINRKIVRALTYPGLVLLMAIAVFILLIVVALPPLVGLFGSLGVELPLPTRIVLAVAAFLTDYRVAILLTVVGLVILIVALARTAGGRKAMERIALGMPAIGSIVIQRAMGRFCRMAAMLLRAGLLLPAIIEIVTRTIGNSLLRQALTDAREKLVQGQSLSESLGQVPLVPRLMVEMVALGEKTGSLESSLATCADLYERSVDRRTTALTAMLEPALTIGVGLLTAFIAISIILPLYSVMQSIKG